VDLSTLVSRIDNFSTRGIAKHSDQTIADLFEERFMLYTRYADITVKCHGLTQEQVYEIIIERALHA